MTTLSPGDLPKQKDLLLPTVRAAAELKREVSAAEQREQVHAIQEHTPEQRAVPYPSGHTSGVLDNRLDFARSRCVKLKLIRPLGWNRYEVTDLGREVAALDDEEA